MGSHWFQIAGLVSKRRLAPCSEDIVRYVGPERGASRSATRGMLYGNAVFYRENSGATAHNYPGLFPLPHSEAKIIGSMEGTNRENSRPTWAYQFHYPP